MARRKSGRKPEKSVLAWEPSADSLLEQGMVAGLAYALQSDGSWRAKEYYERLSSTDQQKFDHLFLLMTEHGKISHPEKFRRDVGQTTCVILGKPIKIAIAEFKVHGRRILAYQRGRWQGDCVHKSFDGNEITN